MNRAESASFIPSTINNHNPSVASKKSAGSAEFRSPISCFPSSWHHSRQTPMKSYYSPLRPESQRAGSLSSLKDVRPIFNTQSENSDTFLEKDQHSSSSLSSVPIPRPVPVPTGKVLTKNNAGLETTK